MEDTITLTLPTRWVVGLGLLAGLILVSVVVGLILPRSTHVEPPLEAMQKRLGLDGLNPGAFLILAIFWLALFAVLLGGLFWLIWQVLWQMLPDQEDSAAVWNFRFMLVQITALTAVLGAVVSLPLTLNRLRLQREANRTADESLFNQKITEAAADLHARRQRTRRGIDRSVDVWEDDIVRRNAAINRLEGLVAERMRASVEDAAKRDVLDRVSRLLSTYVRELSTEVPAKPTPKDLSASGYAWVRTLKPRSDMEIAAQTLGRLRKWGGDLADAVEIDLEGANLQGCRLVGLDFDNGRKKSNFARARMQGAQLRGTRLKGADLREARLLVADLFEARLQRADVRGARMQRANLFGARMQGANLHGARLQGAELFEARLQGADLSGVRLQGAQCDGVWLQGADLRHARLQRAQLGGARLQGADLRDARMDDVTNLSTANLRGAAFTAGGATKLAQLATGKLATFWEVIFSAGTVHLPDGKRPEHWPDKNLGLLEFEKEWHRVMREHFGMNPENPE